MANSKKDKNTTATATNSNWMPDVVSHLEKLASANESGLIAAEQINALVKSDPLLKDKSAVALRGKLVSMGLYQKAEANTGGTGRSRPQKQELVNAIAILIGMDGDQADSLVKANFDTLNTLKNKLVSLSDRVNADQ